jgi:hypothetical protein
VLADDVVHVLLVPVAGVGDHDLRLVVTPACSSSWRAVSIIGRRCEKSGALVETSAAITICCSVTTVCAL